MCKCNCQPQEEAIKEKLKVMSGMDEECNHENSDSKETTKRVQVESYPIFTLKKFETNVQGVVVNGLVRTTDDSIFPNDMIMIRTDDDKGLFSFKVKNADTRKILDTLNVWEKVGIAIASTAVQLREEHLKVKANIE